jgi:hypothetical protein
MIKYCHILFLLLISALFFACRENINFSNSNDAQLNFSTDTVLFDTIFTTIGSTTRQFKFYNNNDDAVKTSISLAGGNNSYYRLNIDGQPANKIEDYEIMAHDSAFVFVEVNIDPQNSNSPMVVDDSIIFVTNRNTQNVKLVAYGQDVHLYNDSVIDTRTWTADKPYLIYNSVLIDKNQTLTIDKGVKIYFHKESAMWVLGTLKVHGTAENPVTFQGDRLEEWYEYAPGQWYAHYINKEQGIKYLTGGIHFWKGSNNNIIDHAIIKNGAKGIQVDSVGEGNNPTLTLSNSIVKNMSAIGLMLQSSSVLVYNSVIANCGYYAVVLSLGGNYEFYHTTIGNYYEFDSRKTPSLIFNNYYKNNDQYFTFDFSAIFGNSIIYGDIDNEFYVDQHIDETKTFVFKFDHCLMKLDDEFDTSNKEVFINIIRDKDSLPRFANTYEGNYRLDTLSAAINKGSTYYSTFYPYDQDGNDRNMDGKPDLGAYERVPE